ncbi:MAG: type II toxin-antitoxin system VapC family toxin [Chloroflexi bacterium]|nr:type II toxin-antitoxin system VapC family toxin [Chloroflexota bacterium]
MGFSSVNAVFDTNIVIDALNGAPEADAEFGRYERVFISRVTWMEVLVGAQDDDTQLRDFMETHFEIVALDLAVAETAVQLRRTNHLRLPDAIIWATAQTQKAILVTRNTKDFNPEWEGIRVPYKI